MRRTPSFSGTVEFASTFAPRPGVGHVLFDFDGTLSLIREGWVEVMTTMFLEMLPRRTGETRQEARSLLVDDITRLTDAGTVE